VIRPYLGLLSEPSDPYVTRLWVFPQTYVTVHRKLPIPM